MNISKHTLIAFYQNLGKLFYAIAAADNVVRDEEFLKLKYIVRRDWLLVEPIHSHHEIEVENIMMNTFNWLRDDNEYDADTCYNGFVDFKKKHANLFHKEINKRILETSGAIAASFSGINKSELIMMAKLNLELKKSDMNYYFTTIISGDFEDIETHVITLLAEEGFGVLTKIDMQKTLKAKLNVTFNKYKILGACNPHFAHKALQEEDKIGTMLPCNIIIQEIAPDTIEVSAINPIVSMQSVNNKALKDVAVGVSSRLENVIKILKNEK